MRSLTVLLILLSAPGLALAQAGRFLLAVGDVAVARGQAEIRAATGTPVQSGDTIRVGPASNAQIRMTDESSSVSGLAPYCASTPMSTRGRPSRAAFSA